MLHLSQLLSRFKNITNSEKVQKESICEILKEYNIILQHTQILFSKNIIFLKVNPLIKTEVALRKLDILKKITNTKGLNCFKDIF